MWFQFSFKSVQRKFRIAQLQRERVPCITDNAKNRILADLTSETEAGYGSAAEQGSYSITLS